jgi:hypothetical protein
VLLLLLASDVKNNNIAAKNALILLHKFSQVTAKKSKKSEQNMRSSGKKNRRWTGSMKIISKAWKRLIRNNCRNWRVRIVERLMY